MLTAEKWLGRRDSTPCFGQLEDSLAAKCSAIGVPANFSPSRRAKSNTELRGR